MVQIISKYSTLKIKRTIRLPILPHVALSTTYDYFRKKNIKEDTIVKSSRYFLEDKKKQETTK